MPDYSQYPSGSDVQVLLGLLGISLPSFTPDDLQAAADAARDEWEQRTCWRPFLASTKETRAYDPWRPGSPYGRWAASRGGRMLQLDAGLLDCDDLGVSIGVLPNTTTQVGTADGVDSTAGSQGVVLTRGIQYYLVPNNAPQQGLPWEYVQFLGPVDGLPQSINITGVWGRVRKLPADVWKVIQQKAVAVLSEETNLNLTGGVGAVKDQNLDVEWVTRSGLSQISQAAANWNVAFDKAVRRWKRVTV